MHGHTGTGTLILVNGYHEEEFWQFTSWFY